MRQSPCDLDVLATHGPQNATNLDQSERVVRAVLHITWNAVTNSGRMRRVVWAAVAVKNSATVGVHRAGSTETHRLVGLRRTRFARAFVNVLQLMPIRGRPAHAPTLSSHAAMTCVNSARK